jgi:hypothetical protein
VRTHLLPRHQIADASLREAASTLGRCQPLFVTFRLYGSLPAKRVFPPEIVAHSGKAFVAMDRLLDRGATGPLYLGRREIAEMVVDAVRDGDRRFHRYDLHAFVVMANHVHLLATPNLTFALQRRFTRWVVLNPSAINTAFRKNVE